MMSSRISKRRPRSPRADPSLTHFEALLIAQAAYELGTSPSAWPAVAKLLSKHPLVSRSKSFFTSQSCLSFYNSLLVSAGFEPSTQNTPPHAPLNLKLAQKCFQTRFAELKNLIAAEESKFTKIVAELKEIHDGVWDEKLKARITGRSSSQEEPDEEPTAAVAGEETLDGADLNCIASSSSSRHHERTPAQATATEPEFKVQLVPEDSSLVDNEIEERDANKELIEETAYDVTAAEKDQLEETVSEGESTAEMDIEVLQTPNVELEADSSIDQVTLKPNDDVQTTTPDAVAPLSPMQVDATETEEDQAEESELADELVPTLSATPLEITDEDAHAGPMHGNSAANASPVDTISKGAGPSVQHREEEEEEEPELYRNPEEEESDHEDSAHLPIGYAEQLENTREEQQVQRQEHVREPQKEPVDHEEYLSLTEQSSVDKDSFPNELAQELRNLNSENMEAQTEMEDNQRTETRDQETEVEIDFEKEPEVEIEALRGQEPMQEGANDDASDKVEVETDQEEQDDQEEQEQENPKIIRARYKKLSTPANNEELAVDSGDHQSEGADTQTENQEGQSASEEPPQTTRRSTRRRKSSVASHFPPLQTRGRLRHQQRQVTEEAQTPMLIDVDDLESEVKEESPQPEEESISSPAPVDAIGTRRRDGKRKAPFIEDIDSPREKKRAREESEAMEDDDLGPNALARLRPTRHNMRTEEQVALKRFQNVITMLHNQISQHRNGNIFHNPIKNSEAPDYRDIVKRPMDLKTIKTKVKDGLIANSLEYQRDIYLMFANAMMYNKPGSDVHSMAEDMMLESEGYILTFRQTEGYVRGAHRI